MTELIWDGKYDKDGNRVAPVRIVLPFQTIETINESVQERQRALDFATEGRDGEWRNRLIWGDKKYVLPSLLDEFAGKVNLIYIDPPFDTGADFSFIAKVPDSAESFTKQPSVIEQKAYRDTWGRGVDSYLQWFADTAVLVREMLADDGSFYVHLDWHVGHYAKIVLDEVFGPDCFVNEVVWQKLRSVKSQSAHFPNMHDVILTYAKTVPAKHNAQFVAKDPGLLKSHYRHTDAETGRRYNLDNFTQKGDGPPRRFGDTVLAPPAGKHWIWSQERIDDAWEQGLIVFSKGGSRTSRGISTTMRAHASVISGPT